MTVEISRWGVFALGFDRLGSVYQLVYTDAEIVQVFLYPERAPAGDARPSRMEVGVTQELLSAMYLLAMGKDWPYERFGDIWCGLLTGSFCEHPELKPHCVELFEIQDKLWKMIDQMTLSGCDVYEPHLGREIESLLLRSHPRNGGQANDRQQFVSGRRLYLCRAITLDTASQRGAIPGAASVAETAPRSGGGLFSEIADHFQLSLRERRLLELLASGLSCKQIAEYLGVPSPAIVTLVAQIMIKMGASTRSETVKEILDRILREQKSHISVEGVELHVVYTGEGKGIGSSTVVAHNCAGPLLPAA